MKQWLFGLGLCALLGSAAAQQVWKCEEADGVVRYTDQPCDAQGRPVPARSLQPNGADSPKPELAAAASAPQAGASAAVAAPPTASAVADRSTRRRTADARSRQRDPLAPMPAGFVQRGNPRAQNVASLPTP